MTPPTTKWTRLRRRLAADGNPLRRPADKAAAWLLPAAVVAFLVLSPLAVAAADALAHAGISAAGQAQRSWRQVPATTLAPAAGPVQPAQAADSWTTWVPARWLVAGRPQTGEIPVPAGTWAGRTVPVWLDPSGRVQIPPPSPGAVRGRVLAAAGMALASLALLLATRGGGGLGRAHPPPPGQLGHRLAGREPVRPPRLALRDHGTAPGSSGRRPVKTCAGRSPG